MVKMDNWNIFYATRVSSKIGQDKKDSSIYVRMFCGMLKYSYCLL